MSVTIKGVSTTMFAMMRTADKIYDGQLEYLDRMAKKVQKRAIEYAPIDEGNLEDAIVIERIADRTNRRRITIFVGVDPSLLGVGFTRHGFRYDEFVHEHMSPFGSGVVKAGELTQAKSDKAGGKFLERAFNDFEEEMVSEMQAIASRAR